MRSLRSSVLLLTLSFSLPAFVGPACAEATVPYLERWGIYGLDLGSGGIELIYSCPEEISGLGLNGAGDMFAFSKMIGGEGEEFWEICTLGADGGVLFRVTDNGFMDVYPAWSPDGSRIAFLSMRGETLDIYVAGLEGGGEELLYDSGFHDADIHWVGGKIAFTRNSQTWLMDEDGTGAAQVTDPPRAGEWGNSVLPFGDYDPRISPDGSKIVFERMVDDGSPHGNYDLYMVNADGSGEEALTENGWTQGLATWSHSGERIAYIVSAVGAEGRYDIHLMNSDGSDSRDLTSEIFPPGFLAHCAAFSQDDSRIYFIGEWWGWKVLESTIYCFTSSSEVNLGDPITVTGSIQPPVTGASVTLTYTGPGGSKVTRAVNTGQDGSYGDSYEPQEAGLWRVEASWEGDAGHQSSSSQPSEFTVLEPEEPPGGIPGFPHGSMVIGLLLGALIIWASRERVSGRVYGVVGRNPP